MTGIPHAVLTGFMGSGKSTVGSALADALGVGYLDTDAELERRAGRTIPEIFVDDGEAAFRALERDVVLDALATFDGVVALGGGSVTVPDIAAALSDHPVVYLRIGPAEGFARVEHSDRPLLNDPDPAGRYAELLAARVPAYEAVATHVVDATAPVDVVVERVLSLLAPRGPEPADRSTA
ncbi:shikimate kinase [Gordonia iterans]